MSEPGAGSGRSEVMLWQGVSCEKGAMLVKHTQAGLRVTAWFVHVPGPASLLQGSVRGCPPQMSWTQQQRVHFRVKAQTMAGAEVSPALCPCLLPAG